MPTFPTRRDFLTEVGRGTLLAALGPAFAADFGLAAEPAETVPLHFGELEPLVGFLQETPVASLQPALLKKLREGVSLDRLVAAGVLANARSFGGEDYIGFHTLMALGPARQMAAALPERQQPLPVFKVLYRNTQRIQEHGGRTAEVLHPVAAAPGAPGPAELRAAVRGRDTAAAEAVFAALMARDAQGGFQALLECVQENPEVHRTVLPYRAWDLLDLVGREHATTLLRMSLRYCLEAESRRRPEWEETGRLVGRLFEEHQLHGREPGTRTLDDAAVAKLERDIFLGTPEDAAAAVASALGDGVDPREVGEAVSLAANAIVLHDRGRPPEWEATGKPAGSVHGDSIGVHASDSVHAWRNLAQVSRGRHVFACLILAAWQVARDRAGQPFSDWPPVPSAYQLRQVTSTEPGVLLDQLDAHLRANLQGHAAAVVTRWNALGLPEGPLWSLLLKYAVSEDGALHAEKYYQTCRDEFARTRPALRGRHLVALARVTASECGRPAPGQDEARRLLGV